MNSLTRPRSLPALAAAGLAVAACSLFTPAASLPANATATVQAFIQTSVAATLTAIPPATPSPQPTITPTPEPSATACLPMVTATVNANVRNGPGTSYDVISSLPLGESARVTATDETGTWWYIELDGGHAWIAARVTTAVCIPNDLRVIAY